MIHLLLLWYCWSKNSATWLVRSIRNPKMSKFDSFCIVSNVLILHSKLILLLFGISSTLKSILQFHKKFDVPGHFWSHQECWFQFFFEHLKNCPCQKLKLPIDSFRRKNPSGEIWQDKCNWAILGSSFYRKWNLLRKFECYFK